MHHLHSWVLAQDRQVIVWTEQVGIIHFCVLNSHWAPCPRWWSWTPIAVGIYTLIIGIFPLKRCRDYYHSPTTKRQPYDSGNPTHTRRPAGLWKLEEMLSEDPESSSHFLQLVRGDCWPWKKTASVFVVQLWFDWCVFTTVTKIRKPKVWWPGNEIHVKKQVIGIIQQQNRYIKSTSNLEGLKDFKKHTCFWVAVLLAPRGLRREICSTCSWDQVCSHHCGFAGRVFNLDFFGKERLHTSHFVSWKKSPFGRKTPGFSQKPPRVWGKKLGCLLIFLRWSSCLIDLCFAPWKTLSQLSNKTTCQKRGPSTRVIGFFYGFLPI